MRQFMRQSAPDLPSTAYPERKISCMGNPFFNVDPMASQRRAMDATRRALSPTDSVSRILNMTQPRVDPVEDHHRRMGAVEKALFSSQSVDRMLRFVQPVDPMAVHRQRMGAAQKALFPSDSSVTRILNMTQPRIDPMADHQRRMEALERALFPSQGIDQILRFVQPIDPIGARKALDPMSEYRRITGSFSALTGVDPSRFTAASPVDNQVAGSEARVYSPNLGLIVNLLGIAWVCGWLLARGADVERVGSLMLAAVALAVFLAERNADT
jgi:hypothetical protein